MRKFSTNISSNTDFFNPCTTFRSNFFFSQYRKISLGNTSMYQKISGSEKLYASERGYQDFWWKIFCLTVPKISVGGSFRVSLISGIEKFLCFRGLFHDFRFSVEKFLSHSAEKFRRWTLLSCFRNFPVAKNFMDKMGGGVSRLSVENFLSHSAQNFHEWGDPLVFH